ncbi:MAG TPA: hypothetical protein DE147_09215 [Gammaproteobacteria bacterium]|nr:hypothetical protein [Gammaproteobacteria bacterium]
MMRGLMTLVVLLLSNMTQADTLIMANGDRLTGRLDSISGGKVVFATTYAGRIAVSLAQVHTLVTQESYTIALKDRRLDGVFTARGDAQQLLGPDGAELLALQSIRSASQSRNALTQFTADWGSRLDLALSLTEGNSTTEASNILFEMDYADELNEHLVTVLLAREEGEGLLTKDQLDIDYGYKRFISERWYGAANAEYFQDTLKDVDLRITLGAGVGVQFIDNSLQSLASDLSLSAVQEDVGGASELQPALRWGLNYERFLLGKTLEVFHRQSVLQLLGDEQSQVFSSSTGARYALNERIDTTFRIDLAYESDPPQGNEKTDTTYSLGVGVKF